MEDKLVRLEVEISPRADELISEMMAGSGYGTKGMVIQEAIFALKELMDLYRKQSQPAELRGVLSTFTRFTEL